MSRRPPHIAMVVVRLGPYHVARMAAAAALVGAENFLAIEMASADKEYQWAAVADSSFRRRTLIRDRPYEEVPARELRSALSVVLDDERPEALALVGWSPPETRAGLRWCRRNRVPAILFSDSNEGDTQRSKLRELLKSFIVREFDSAVVAGRSSGLYAERLGIARTRIFPGWDVVDNDHFSRGAANARGNAALRATLGLPHHYFLCSARFIPQKNLFALLHAFARYRRNCTTDAWDLVLVGDGPLRAQIETAIRDTQLNDAVHLTGFRQYCELPSYYGLASAFVLPSVQETWGLVVNEAMAARLPVIVSNRCGVADIVVDGENGWIFDPRSEEQLAARLSEMSSLGPESLGRMALRAYETIVPWSPQRFALALLRAARVGADHRSRRRQALPNPLLWT